MTIDQAHESARRAYRDWAGFLMNPRFIRSGTRLTWVGGRDVFLQEPIRGLSMIDLVEAGAYSFQIKEDEAVVQWQYDFGSRGRVLERAQLAYYTLSQAEGGEEPITSGGSPTTAADGSSDDELPSGTRTQADGDSEEDEANERTYPGSHDLATWFRIDFIARDAPDVLHHCCHLHVGGVPRSRIALNRVPNPGQFLEWIFALRYPASYGKHRLDERRQYRDEEHARSIAHPHFSVDLRTAGICVPHVAFPDGGTTEP